MAKLRRVRGTRDPERKKTNRNEHSDGEAWVLEIFTALVAVSHAPAIIVLLAAEKQT